MDKYVIPNLRNACRLLKTLAQGVDARRVAELARQLGFPATTTLRIVRTLEREGFVRNDRGELYLGPALIHLGNAALKDTAIPREAQPVLLALTQATEETAHVAVPCDHRSLIVAVNDSPHPLRAASRPGALTDLHCTSTGKIFLAYTFYDELDTLLPTLSLTARTKNTLTTPAALRKNIEAIRKCGYAVDNEEIHPGVRCLATPVFGADRTAVAAIGITAAAARFTKPDDARIAEHVKAAAEELSRKLGGSR